MSTRYGALSYIKFAFQNSFGGVDTTSSQAFPCISESLKLSIDRLQKSPKSRFTKSRSVQGKQGNSGGISFLGYPTALAYGLKSVLGHDYSTYSSGLHSHFFAVPENDFNRHVATVPATIEINDGKSANSAFFQDMAGNSININIAAGEFVNCELEFLGTIQTEGIKTADNFLHETPYKWDQCSISFNDVANLDFESISLNVSNNLEQIYTLTTTHNPQRIKRTAQIDIEIRGAALFTSESCFNAFVNNIEYDFNLSMINAGNAIFNLAIPSLQITDYTSNINDFGLIKLDFIAEAFFNYAGNSVVSISVQNSYGLFPAPFILDDDFYGLLDQDYNILT